MEKQSSRLPAAVREMITNLANQRIETSIEPPCHHLDKAADVIDALIISSRVIPIRDPGEKIALEEGEVGYR